MVKILVTMPPELVAQLDSTAERRGVSRSALLREAARQELGHEVDIEEARAAVKRMRARFAGTEPLDAAQAIRWERDHGHSTG